MKRYLLKLTLGISVATFSFNSQAQCPVIACGNDTTVTTDASMCDAIVNYSMPLAADTCSPTGFQTFNYTGAMQTFVVPNGVTSINVDAYGAQGGSNSPQTNINYGGRVQADIPVTPGTTIYIYVGEQPSGLTGGWNGGGNGESAGKGGGGASDIRIGGTTLNDRVVVAGGAGGGGFWSSQEVHGGLGGGLIGGNGYRTDFSSAPGGEGGTQSSSGNGTCVSLNNPAMAGGFGFGGAPSSCGCEGYGGGGGWYGGAGSGNCRGGGGGSSYTDPSATNVIHTQGVKVGHGSITLSWSGATPALTQIAGLPSGAAFPIGTTVNTYVAESGGNADTCSFTITVVDNQAPTIICPSSTIEVCEGTPVSAPGAVTSDNCGGETVTYSTSGATTITGADSISGVLFNPGTTTVWYIATDSAGNADSCSFDVIVTSAPTVSLDPFSVDSLCNYSDPIALPSGMPMSGTYSGAGVSGGNFDPAVSGNGTFYITYTVTDSLGCIGTDSSMIIVHGCAGLGELNAFENVRVYPNPSKGKFNVVIDGQQGQADYQLTTVDGRIIASESFELDKNLSIDLSTEPAGYYLLELRGENSTKLIRLIKE